MSIKKRIIAGVFSFISLTVFGSSSFNAKTFKETLTMDNDAPSGANYSNPTSTNEKWTYYPKYGYGMNDYLTGSSYYNNDARGGYCKKSTYVNGSVSGRTAYVWKWTGKDNTVPGSIITVTVSFCDKRFTAGEVAYHQYDENYLDYAGLHLGTIDQDTAPLSVKFPARRLNNPRKGPYIVAVDASLNGYKNGDYMSADKVVIEHTKYISSK